MATGGGGVPRHGRVTRPKADMPFAVTDTEHPPPPQELNEEEAEIWRATVNRLPPDYFAPPTWPLLVALCRHTRTARMFARQSAEYETVLPYVADDKKHEILRLMMALSRAQSGESRVIATLCMRLKITQLTDSTNIHKARRSFLNEQKPWDVPGDVDGDGLQ